METSEGTFDMAERQKEQEYKVELIAPNGLGFGEGGISVQTQIENGELHRESLEAAIEIVTHDEEVYVQVDDEANDDGCGDGRETSRIYKLLDPLTNETQEFKRSLRRAKLFGGGLIAASSMWRAVDGDPKAKTLHGDRAFIQAELKKRGVSYGAHTDDHAEGENCGCGAIDKYDVISSNVLKYKNNILDTLQALYGSAFEDNADAISSVYSVYEQLGEEYFNGLTGKSTMSDIEKDGAVVKQLRGKHMEDMVVLNDVEGTTLDQEKLREKLVAKGLSPNIQAFAVDAWRGRMYADVVADIADENGHDRDEAYKIAYADFLIRTLAVSGTLTKGDQPVVLRQKNYDFAV
jgi:hypothetical protein